MVLDLFRLDGRAALVTGAARGIGREAAAALAEAGADVALLDREAMEDAAGLVEAAGRRAVQVRCDLSLLDAAGAAALVADAAERLGRLDVVVCAAGIIRRGPAEEISEADWRDVIQVDLTAAFLLSQAAGRRWIAGGAGGRILHVASMLSFQGGWRAAPYAAAKSGLAGLVRALACEWAPHGINVNAVAPGYFATALTERLRADPHRSAEVLARIPAGRWGEPRDLRGAIVFLASDAAAYVHGAILPVDGGWLAR